MENAVIPTPIEFSVYELMLNDLPEGMLWTNGQGLIVYANRSAAETLIGRDDAITNNRLDSLIDDSAFSAWLKTIDGQLEANKYEISDRSLTLFVLTII